MNKNENKIPFKALVTIRERDSKNDLIGEWIEFPTTTENLKKMIERISIGTIDEHNQVIKEQFITDYDIYVKGVTSTVLANHSNLDELNYFAVKISKMNENEYGRFCAIISQDDYVYSVKDLINVTDNLDIFEILPDVKNYYDLGYYYIEEAGIYDTSRLGELSDYIDYEKYGRKTASDEGGTFTDHGYICERGSILQIYNDPNDIPEKYKVNTAVISKGENTLNLGTYNKNERKIDRLNR